MEPKIQYGPDGKTPLDQMRWGAGDTFQIQGWRIPSWRTAFAIQKGVEHNILMKTWGGLGDQICAEPTLRFALEHFKHSKITLASHIPEVFSHLKFYDVYNLNNYPPPIYDDHLCFETNSDCSIWNLTYQFISHNVVQCVDFPSICALRCTLPVAKKEIILKPPTPSQEKTELWSAYEKRQSAVVVHAGKHWPSKTFPKPWWDSAIRSIIAKGLTPILIGKDNGPGQGTVDTITEGCIDLRNKTTLNETIWLTQQVPVVICNDSSPLHMAVSGKAWIGFVATAKHPDYITHWRNGQWGWRMQNLGLGGYWDIMDYCPNQLEEKTIDQVDPKILDSWLPAPESIGDFCEEKIHDYFRTV